MACVQPRGGLEGQKLKILFIMQNKNKTAQQSKKQKRRQRKKAAAAVSSGRHAAKANVMRAHNFQSDQSGVLARCIALPYEASGLRLPTVDMPRTATMTTRDQFTWSSPVTGPPSWSSGDLLVAFYGQPGRLAMIYGALQTNAPYSVTFAEASSNVDRGSPTWFPLASPVGNEVTWDNPWPLVTLTAASGPHGPTMPIGMSNGVPYVFMNFGDEIIVTPTGAAAGWPTALWQWEVRQWESKNNVATVAANGFMGSTTTVLPGAFTVVGLGTGYYSFYWKGISDLTAGAAAATCGFNIVVRCNAANGWSVKSMGTLDNANGGDAAIGQEMRLNGCSLLMTNTTSFLNRQGTVLGARLRGLDALTVTPATLQKAGEKYTGDASKGVYTFKEFSTYQEIFREVTDITTNGISGMEYDLDMDDFYHFIQITCPTPSTTANVYTVSIDCSVEFKTDVERYVKGVSTYRPLDLIEARRLVNARPVWFYENPLHLDSIYNFIRKGVKAAGKYAPYVASAASAIDPAGAPAYAALMHLIQRMSVG